MINHQLVLVVAHLLGTLDLLQEGAQFPGFSIEGATHSLVVVWGVRRTGQVGRTQLWTRKQLELTI